MQGRKRFRCRPAKLMVIDPGGKVSVERVNVIYDYANDAFGVQVTGGQFGGYVFFVSRTSLISCYEKGSETDSISL